MSTVWTSGISPGKGLVEYPRPQMRRATWKNLNGLWDYAITDSIASCPEIFAGKITVPFAVESILSGVSKPLLPSNALWYKRSFLIDKLSNKRRLLLHFGAVDYKADIYLNGKLIAKHTGGFDGFSIDLKDHVVVGENELVVRVIDPTNTGDNVVGKQTLNPRTSFFTACSGIWQTVWLEEVPLIYIKDLKIGTDIDKGNLYVKADLDKGREYELLLECEGLVAKARADKEITLQIPRAKLWSPDAPHLYSFKLKIMQRGKIIDEVESYFGMRKIEIRRDSLGHERIFLNHKYVYNLGVLDQGYWPDGGYTAPGDKALSFDIETIKSMGFNTIRKHLKVEPDRWYYLCDKLGMLVWQDMPCRSPLIDKSIDGISSRKQFESEMVKLIEQQFNHPSIIMWLPFNEDWAMFDRSRIEGLVRKLDPSRLVNVNTGSRADTIASGDFNSIHHYSYPIMPKAISGKASVLGEFGGVLALIPGHEWREGFSWGHGKAHSLDDYLFQYEDFVSRLIDFEKKGLTASIFTQSFDVEQEECGLMTFDRKIIKIQIPKIRSINQKIYHNNR
ncbi:glycoside hydrolase family 2 protein [Pedobacter sp. P26]|uniref:glycoside hydrolase family 2 protein n=1 Tax=Pedobacter sp. P26 TaxID=3423956 RepID=UPI003D671463